MEHPSSAIDLPLQPSEALRQTRAYLLEVSQHFLMLKGFAVNPWVELLYGVAGPWEVERDLVIYCLAIANGETDRSQWVTQLREGSATFNPDDLDLKGSALQLASSHTVNSDIESDADWFAAMRRRWRIVFTSIVNKRKFTERITLRDADWLGDIWYLPGIEFSQESETKWGHITVITSTAGFDGYVRLLLLDADRPYKKNIKLCSWKDCDRFFLNRSATRPRRFCSDDCLRKAHDAGAPERMQRLRTSKKRRKQK